MYSLENGFLHVLQCTNGPHFISFSDIFRYRALVQQNWSAPYWATLTSTWQLIGTLFYIGGKYLDNFQHLPGNVSAHTSQGVIGLRALDTIMSVQVVCNS